MHCLIHKIATGHRSPVTVEHAIFLDPVHHKITKKSDKNTDGLQRHKVTSKHEQIYHINILTSNLKFWSQMNTVVVFLILTKLAAFIVKKLLGLVLMHRNNFPIK